MMSNDLGVIGNERIKFSESDLLLRAGFWE